jgi:hypothetical protein
MIPWQAPSHAPTTGRHTSLCATRKLAKQLDGLEIASFMQRRHDPRIMMITARQVDALTLVATAVMSGEFLRKPLSAASGEPSIRTEQLVRNRIQRGSTGSVLKADIPSPCRRVIGASSPARRAFP